MHQEVTIQNGTYKQSGKEVGIVAAVNSDSKVNVTVYLSERDKYKTEFNSWSKKTAQATLEMCRVVYDAKNELGSQDFLKFCNEIGRKGEDATVRKYLRIGEKYEKFYQYADFLPNSWTSIYEITQLSSETFEALVTTESSLANMTGEQIKLLMGKKTDEKSKSSAASADMTSTAQTATEASEIVAEASSKTPVSGTAAASSDVIQSDSSDSVSDADASIEAASDKALSDADRDFVKQATNTMLERVSGITSTSTAIAEVAMQPHEVLIRFNTIPTDDMWFDLVEEIENIVQRYNFDVEVMEKRSALAL